MVLKSAMRRAVVYMVIADELIGRHDPAYRNYPAYACKFGENYDLWLKVKSKYKKKKIKCIHYAAIPQRKTFCKKYNK